MAEEQVTILLDDGTTVTPIGVTGDMSAEFRTKALDLGSDKDEKIIEGLIFEIEAEDDTWLNNIQFSIGTADRLTVDPVWYGPYNIDQKDAPIWLPQSVEASRYIYLYFQDLQVLGFWSLSAVEILGYHDGGRM